MEKGKVRFVRIFMCVMLSMMLVVAPLQASAASKNVKILKVTSDYVRVRSEPKQGDNVVTRVRKNEKVFYLGASKTAKGWCKVRTDHGKIGYLYKDYLSFYGATKLSNVYMVKPTSLKMYKKASTSSGRVMTLDKNEHVIVYKTKGGWAYVATLSGKAGYVKLSSLKKAA